MLVDFTQKIKELDGKEVSTLEKICCNALFSLSDADKNMKGEDKCAMYKLGMRIHEAKEPVEITPEESTMLRSRVNMFYSALVVGQAWIMLEGVR